MACLFKQTESWQVPAPSFSLFLGQQTLPKRVTNHPQFIYMSQTQTICAYVFPLFVHVKQAEEQRILDPLLSVLWYMLIIVVLSVIILSALSNVNLTFFDHSSLSLSLFWAACKEDARLFFCFYVEHQLTVYASPMFFPLAEPSKFVRFWLQTSPK